MADYEYLYRKNQYMKDFILLYKSLPCLWKIKSQAYHNRELRKDAYTVLTKQLRKMDPIADRGAVVRKINSLRSNLRKEQRKVALMAKQGVKYEPKLWYYSLFDFLDGQEKKQTRTEDNNETIELEDDTETLDISNIKQEEDGLRLEFEVDNYDDDPLESFEKLEDDETSREVTPPPKVLDSPPSPKTFKKNAKPEVAQASSSKNIPEMQAISNTTHQVSNSHSTQGGEDQYDVFGKNVAAKLRDIANRDNVQRLMAEKIVNDALFLAEMRYLTLPHCSRLHTP